VKFRLALLVLSLVILLAALSPLFHVAIAARAQLSTGTPPAESIATHGYVIASKPIKGSAIPGDYTFVLTRDELYVPIIVRKPKGDGPFPAITMGSGEGREGMRKVEQLAECLSQMQDRMLARGYVVATVNYRNEIPYAYEQSKPPQNLPDSISGEMIMKASSEFTFGAGVCIEPADHEFLTVNTGPTAPRKGTEIQYNDIEVARKNANKAEAMERIRRVNTPILIFGRETDHQQGIFNLTYEWMKEAGKDVQWQSFDHPTHGYVFIYNQPDGSYKPDDTQAKTFDIAMDYFDKHLKHGH